MKTRTENRKRQALIIFTREPEPGKTKTRLMPYFSADQCAELHRCFLKDLANEAFKADADIIISHTGSEPVFLRKTFGKKACYVGQKGIDLGQKMENAIGEAFQMGYERAVLIGSDIPEIKAKSINAAFEVLVDHDLVIGPTADGGYYLIGMKTVCHEAFDIKKYGTGSVLEDTLRSVRAAGLTAGMADTHMDIDVPEDIAGYRHRMRSDASLRHSHTGAFLSETSHISIIIPVFNESAEIGMMLEQLKPCLGRCEVIFVDGGSKDDTVDMIKADACWRLLESSKGRGIQMNTGADASVGDILFFLHCDSRLPSGFMDGIIKVMSEHEWGCFGVRFPSRNLFMLTNRIISNQRAGRRGVVFGDQGIFVDREVFIEAGKFPEIPIMEDYEFSLRLRKKGLRPGMAGKRILTSARRYGNSTKDILQTEACMWMLRLMYRRGKSAEELQKWYKDVR